MLGSRRYAATQKPRIISLRRAFADKAALTSADLIWKPSYDTAPRNLGIRQVRLFDTALGWSRLIRLHDGQEVRFLVYFRLIHVTEYEFMPKKH